MIRLNTEMLDKLLAGQGMSRNELARQAGLHRNTLYQLFAGDSDPQLSTLNAIASALHVNPFVLLIDTEQGIKKHKDPHKG